MTAKEALELHFFDKAENRFESELTPIIQTEEEKSPGST
jgi:hypothetical protein